MLRVESSESELVNPKTLRRASQGITRNCRCRKPQRGFTSQPGVAAQRRTPGSAYQIARTLKGFQILPWGLSNLFRVPVSSPFTRGGAAAPLTPAYVVCPRWGRGFNRLSTNLPRNPARPTVANRLPPIVRPAALPADQSTQRTTLQSNPARAGCRDRPAVRYPESRRGELLLRDHTTVRLQS